MVFKEIIFQNKYVALKTPSRPPPPFMANTILNFHFDYLNTSLSNVLNQLALYIIMMSCRLVEYLSVSRAVPGEVMAEPGQDNAL